MKIKLITIFLSIGALLSCGYKDDIEDLQNRVNELEARLGNEPITITFEGQDNDDVDLTETRIFKFESTDWNTGYIYDYGDGTYYFYIERFSDVDWEEYAYLSFYYDHESKEVTEINYIGADFVIPSIDDDISPTFYANNAGCTVEINVTSFDPATASVSLNASGVTTDAYAYNVFSGKPMSLELSFSGRLTVFRN